MDNGYTIIPGHIRENLKQYSPNITEGNIICLECGYQGQMGFTAKRRWDFGSFFNIGVWGLFALGLLLTIATGGGFLVLIALVLCVYWCLQNIRGNRATLYHCPNCGAVLAIQETN
ncbi:MAG: hypothetical protein ACQES4_10270 [Bacillota bacterium]